jgi:hypothetical protein
MAGEKPSHDLVAANKQSKEKIKLGAAWPAPFDGAWNLKLGGRDGKVFIVHEDAETGHRTRISPETHFVTIFANKDKGERAPAKSAAGHLDDAVDDFGDDIPF